MAKSITSVISLLSATYLIAGIWYNHNYYQAFDISLEDYFTLSDIINVSLSKFFSISLMLLGMLYATYDLLDRVGHRDEKTMNTLDNIMRVFLLLTTVFIAVFLTVIQPSPERFRSYAWLGIILWYYTHPIFIPESLITHLKSITRSHYILLILFIPYMFIYLYFEAKRDIAFLVNNPSSKLQSIQLKNNTTISTSDSIIPVGINSQYVFIWNRNKESVEILLKGNVAKITTKFQPKKLKKK